MRRFAILSLLMLSAVLLQTTLFARSLFGVAPDIIAMVVISLALLEGPVPGAVAGFSGGLLRDLLLNAPKGLSGFAYLIVGYATGSIRPYIQSTSVFLPVAGIFLGTVASTALYEIVNALMGRKSLPFESSVRIVLLTSVYNALLAPFVYPLIRRIVKIYQREKVYRW